MKLERAIGRGEALTVANDWTMLAIQRVPGESTYEVIDRDGTAPHRSIDGRSYKSIREAFEAALEELGDFADGGLG